MNRKAVFLDLNGTLVLPMKQSSSTISIRFPVRLSPSRGLDAAGFVCPVITVQSRIAKGLFTAAEFRDWFREFAAAASLQGAELKGPYVCPHRYAEPCDCKKPKYASLRAGNSRSRAIGCPLLRRRRLAGRHPSGIPHRHAELPGQDGLGRGLRYGRRRQRRSQSCRAIDRGSR
jgi:hypothetical protein